MAVRQLTVLYDPHCGLCREARAWLEKQEKFVPLEFVGAGTALVLRRFPGLDLQDTLRRLHVVSDSGAVYRGVRAWLMILWALRDWRDRSITLAWEPLRPFVALGLWLISTLRVRTSCEGSCGTGHVGAA
jgi:predicted DCC family thiol-disulfide oxidoreductase YuxK